MPAPDECIPIEDLVAVTEVHLSTALGVLLDPVACRRRDRIYMTTPPFGLRTWPA